MSNTRTPANRPSSARKVTRRTEAKRDESNDAGLSVTLAGEVHTVRFGDVTPDIARQLRATTGMGFMQIVAAIAVSPDVDLLAAFIWTERRIAGERVQLKDIEVAYADVFADDFDMSDAIEDEVTGPEA